MQPRVAARRGESVGARLVVLVSVLALWLGPDVALAQQGPPPPAPGWAQPPLPPQVAGGYSPPRARTSRASNFESGTLYVTSLAYGIGLGVWLDAELTPDDPAILLIPPTLLGVAMPVGAYVLNHPTLPRGVPGAISAGMLIGAGEGLGIASLQMFTAEEPWGFVGVSRATALGSTLGGIAGYTVGVLQEPSPNISAFATSGVVWGSLIGSAIGFGASPEYFDFSEANDWMSRAGLIGFNAGLVATMALSTAFVPTLDQLSWMWLGGGIGAVASLPVYLFYLGDGPPPKRGLLFTATAATLGIVAGGVFGPALGSLGLGSEGSRWASIDYLTPLPLPGGLGLQVGGSLF